jgi:hypothetical protein
MYVDGFGWGSACCEWSLHIRGRFGTLAFGGAEGRDGAGLAGIEQNPST